MNINTGREFSFQNPQDDPQLYPKLPVGLYYSYDGSIRAEPKRAKVETPAPKKGEDKKQESPKKVAAPAKQTKA